MRFELFEIIFNNIIKLSGRFENRKVVVFGTGQAGYVTGVVLNNFEIDYYYVDNDQSKWGQSLLGQPVCSPAKLREEGSMLLVLVASSFFAEISAQLSAQGFVYKENYWYIIENVESNLNMEQNHSKKIINNNYRFPNCPVCNNLDNAFSGNISYDSDVWFSSYNILLLKIPELWKCNHCRSYFIQNVIPPELANLLYQASYSVVRWVNSFQPDRSNAIFEQLDRHFRCGTRLMDIGCNDGSMLDYAKTRGCITTGIELCEFSRERVKEKGHQAYATIEEAEGYFDIITAFDLIEHLYDIPSFLEQCRSKLVDGGMMIILTGDISCLSFKLSNSNWWYCNYPEHVVFPSRFSYQQFSKYKLEDWLPVYDMYSSAAQNIVDNVWEVFKRVMLHGDYCGKPACGPDHVLLVLKKSN
ncbi:MAG: class I SAM-dependent methyltransferase [Sporomusaceae bacterium]|nr:class I SAM-dependent methyltransferase [Sporomusaceae bacterium]